MRVRPVAETSTWQHKHSQETNIHGPDGIRTRDPSKRSAVDLRLRPRGHWDRPVLNTRHANRIFSEPYWYTIYGLSGCAVFLAIISQTARFSGGTNSACPEMCVLLVLKCVFCLSWNVCFTCPEMYVLICSTVFTETSLLPKKYHRPRVKCLILLPKFNQTWILSTYFNKTGGRIQIFGKNPTESKIHSWRN
jgi:hypothetical protein